MRKKNRKKSTDSLELLLDTMCNTFGGVMFIAISLVIISSNLKDKSSESRNLDDINLESLKIEIMKAEINNKSLQSQKNKMENKSHGTQILDKNKLKKYKNSSKNLSLKRKVLIQKMQKIEKSKRKIEDLKKNENKIKKETVSSLKRKSQSLRTFSENKKNLENKILSIKKKLKNMDSREIKFRKIKPDKTRYPFFVLLSDNKLYRINRNSDSSLNFSSDVYKEKDSIRQQIFYFFKPKLGRGRPLKSDEEISMAIRPVSKENNIVSILVMEDSFDSLIRIIEFLQKNNYRYNIHPINNFDEVSIQLVKNAEYESQ